MIYLTNGNMPLNAAYADEIVQEDNSTYQLTFRFPTSDSLWEQLKEETFLTADDLHGEQDFVIFEVEKKHGYIQVYANQVFTLLNNYVVSPLALDRATGSTALSRFAGSITRDNPFSFFSDIEDRHTFNVGSKNAMEAFAKDKHSIIGQWGGDLVRHGYQVRLLKNGGSENESLFMYKKNLSSYQHKTSTKSLKTRITFTATVKGGGEKAPDRKFSVVVDSPLINKYSQIYEDVIEVNDQDVKDEASLRKYGEQYYRTSLCDMMEDSLELEVVGQSDVPVQMFDIVSLFHDVYNLDVRKKITKYTYSPMGKKLKTIGFGQFKLGLANAIGNAVSDAVKGEAQQLQSDFERQLARELKNADLAFDKQKEELVNQFTDGLNAAKARAEEVKRELSDTINQRFDAGDLISGINLGANGHNRFVGKLTHITGETLIDKAVIKSAMVDKLKTANFEAGSVTTTILDTEAVTADNVRMDQAFANKLVASNIFTDTLAAKEAFINKLRSVVVTATLLEGYKGKIGGFQIGTHEKDSSVYWITGQNQFSVGMSNGTGQWSQTALWVNWGKNWGHPGDYAWYVKNNGKMYCYNTAEFWNTPVIHGNLRVTGHIYYNNENSGKTGHWIHSSKYSNFEPSNNYLYLYYSGSGYDWIPMNKEISDRRYKTNIKDSTVSGLDVVKNLKTYSYRKEYDGKIEDIACGIMAQDVQKYAPEAFFENPDGAYSYRTFELVPYLIKAIQELNQKLEEIA